MKKRKADQLSLPFQEGPPQSKLKLSLEISRPQTPVFPSKLTFLCCHCEEDLLTYELSFPSPPQSINDFLELIPFRAVHSSFGRTLKELRKRLPTASSTFLDTFGEVTFHHIRIFSRKQQDLQANHILDLKT